MKPTLFIDFDGTLCHDKFWRILDPQIKQKITVFQSGVARKWMKGEYTSEEVNRLVAEESGVSYDDLWNIFVKDCETMAVSKEALNLLSVLRNEYHIVLITDNMDCLDRFTVPALHLNDHFDLIINSYNEKAGKCDNNGASFLKALDTLGSEIAGSRLIDNSQSACDLFERLGGKSHFVDTTTSLEQWLTRIGSEVADFVD